MKKTLLCAALFGLTLTACSDKGSNNAASAASSASAASAASPAAACAHPALNAQVKEAVQQQVRDAAQAAAKRSGSIIDADKLIAAAAQLTVETANPQFAAAQNACSAQVSIRVPQDVLATAEKFAPLLSADAPSEQINSRLQGSNGSFDGQTLSFPLNYTITDGTLQSNDGNLRSHVKTLADALMAYAVKDTISVNGKMLKRTEALRRLNEPEKPVEASAPPTAEEVAPLGANIPEPPAPAQMQQPKPKTQSDADSAVEPAAPVPDALTPGKPARSRITQPELDEALRANGEAGTDIKRAWSRIDPEVQRDLMEDQRSWEQKKNQSCRSAAAKGGDNVESQYLRIQCDTRMTRERVQKLRGYSID